MPISGVPRKKINFSLVITDYERLKVLAEKTDRTVPGYVRSLVLQHIWDMIGESKTGRVEYCDELVLHIPRSLHKELKETAGAEGVDLNQYVLYKLSR